MSRLDHQHLTKTFSGSALVKLGSLCLGFLLTLVLARTLSPEGYGIYSYVLALITIAAIPAQMGVPEVVIRETSRFHSNESWATLKGLWHWSLLAVLTTSVLAIFIAAICYLLLSPQINSEYRNTLFIGLFLLPFMAFASLRGAMLSGLRRVVIGQLPDHILRPMTLAILVVVSLILDMQISPANVMLYHVIAALVAFFIGTYFLLRYAPAEIKESEEIKKYTSEWVKSAIPLALVSGMYIVNQQLDILFLGWLGTAEDVGIYKVISQMGMFVIFGQQMVRGVISTEISRYWSQNNLEKLEQIVQLSGKISFGIASIVSVIFIFFGKPLLGLLFGAEYSIGYWAMVVLCVGQLTNASFGSLGSVLSMTGYANSSLISLCASIIINCLLNIFLIPLWGLEGAACATTISVIVWNIMLWRIVRKKICIRPTIFRV